MEGFVIIALGALIWYLVAKAGKQREQTTSDEEGAAGTFARQREDSLLTRRQVADRFGRDRYPEWFAGFPEHLWPDRVRLTRIEGVEEECEKLVKARAEREEVHKASPVERAKLEERRKAIPEAVAEARAEFKRHWEGSEERVFDVLGTEREREELELLEREEPWVFDAEDLESQLEQEERDLELELEYADGNIEDVERDRDSEAAWMIMDQMNEELEEVAPAIIRVVDHELGLIWTEKDAGLLEELRTFYGGTEHIHAPFDGEPPALPEYPEHWLDPEKHGIDRKKYPNLAPLFSDELGRLTKEDFAFIREHHDLRTADDDLYDFVDYDIDNGLKLDAYPRTERGRLRFAQLFAERRRRQRELMDKLRSPAFRARLGTVKEGLDAKRTGLLGAKREGILSAASATDAEVANTVRGELFERHVAEVLSAEWQGFECQHLGLHKKTERGIDLLFLGPNGEKIGVQCKQHADTREPSYQEWQSFLGGCTFHEIPEGSRVFVTTGTLTVRQIQEAKKLGVIVFYKDELAQMAEEHGIEPWRQP